MHLRPKDGPINQVNNLDGNKIKDVKNILKVFYIDGDYGLDQTV